jgi:hypothetical protein
MRRLRYAGLLVLVLVVGGCKGRPAPEVPVIDVPRDEERIVQREPVPIQRQIDGQSDIIQLVVNERGFTPRLIKAAEGSRVKIHLRNAGTREHRLVIQRFGIVTSLLPPGGENYIEFTASAKGDWPFHAEVDDRPEPGLAGILKVE